MHKIIVSAVTRRHRSVFGIFLAHQNSVCVAQLSCCEKIGWFVQPELLEKFAIYWFGRGSGHLEKFRAPASNQKIGIEKMLQILFFCCGSNELNFVENGGIVAPGALYRGLAHSKDLAVLRPQVGGHKIPARPGSVLD